MTQNKWDVIENWIKTGFFAIAFEKYLYQNVRLSYSVSNAFLHVILSNTLFSKDSRGIAATREITLTGLITCTLQRYRYQTMVKYAVFFIH